jgi:hypothetical protein
MRRWNSKTPRGCSLLSRCLMAVLTSRALIDKYDRSHRKPISTPLQFPYFTPDFLQRGRNINMPILDVHVNADNRECLFLFAHSFPQPITRPFTVPRNLTAASHNIYCAELGPPLKLCFGIALSG